jgi:hypothetical protein
LNPANTPGPFKLSKRITPVTRIRKIKNTTGLMSVNKKKSKKMKSKFFKLCTVVLLFLFMGASCQKDEIEYADESISISSWPAISVYKTKGDYFSNITVGINDKKAISSYPDYNVKSDNVLVNKNGEYNFKYKWLLKSGYIVVQGGDFNCAVTNISLTEYINFNEPFKTNWDTVLLAARIIDKDPFTEFYFLDGVNKNPKTYTLGEINNMIENDALETVFTKLK